VQSTKYNIDNYVLFFTSVLTVRNSLTASERNAALWWCVFRKSVGLNAVTGIEFTSRPERIDDGTRDRDGSKKVRVSADAED